MDASTLKLLEKALSTSPDDWETRAHLMQHYLSANEAHLAEALLQAAPRIPDDEPSALLKAQIEMELRPIDAIRTLNEIITHNRGCAMAYLLYAWALCRQGLKEEAKKKYGAATVIDESLRDAGLEQQLGLEPDALVPLGTATTGDDSAIGVSEDEITAAMKALEAPEVPEPPKTTFADIGGMESVIERIRMNIVYPFKNPQIFQKFNKKPGGGILLYGPPGCGKTHIARATAGECGAVFIPMAITDVLSKWLGESEQHLHEFFVVARRRSPSVIFIDEMDAIGVSRSDASSSMAPIVNVLLTEMDGISTSNDSLMVLAATNAPWRVDSALRRPGRFDRVIFVPPPDAAARAAILKIQLRNVPCDSLDLDQLAEMTEQFSGADLRAVVERASEHAIFAEMKSGVAGKLTQKTLIKAIKETRPSTAEWLETARNYATYANRTGLYDDLVAYFEKKR
jgi:transitional endoplasmic reticulum ATPase